MKKENTVQNTTKPMAYDALLCAGLSEDKIETRYAKDTGLSCPKCGENRMSRHLQHGKRFCWAGCGWLD